ncbi:hypothetical protein EYF80_057494 [Liparis tanakae]|uniref:Uncharacterized protein n=1 Tax=Liparis tanakae TaxID=230148 RepID=A0A4Z2ETV9_9TELE|nr:hypothetical protein EYF80_057494 [Liparis tanakae]
MTQVCENNSTESERHLFLMGILQKEDTETQSCFLLSSLPAAEERGDLNELVADADALGGQRANKRVYGRSRTLQDGRTLTGNLAVMSA